MYSDSTRSIDIGAWFPDFGSGILGRLGEGKADELDLGRWLRINLPVGNLATGGGSSIIEGISIPPLDAEPTTFPQSPLPPPIDRRDTPLDQTGTPVTPIVQRVPLMEVSWQEWINNGNPLPDDWNQYPNPAAKAAAMGIVEPVIVDIQDDDMGILGDIYDIVDTGVGGWLPGGVPPGSSFPTTGMPPGFGGPVIQPFPGVTPTTPGVPNMPNMPASPAACGDDPMKGMVYKKVCGVWKWVKVKRRRKGALATKRQIKDLAALKGVVGVGKTMEVWVATHS